MSLYDFAVHKMLDCAEYSREWCFWRGIAVAEESNMPNSMVDTDWLEALAKLAAERDK